LVQVSLLGDFGQMAEAEGLEDGDEGDAVYGQTSAKWRMRFHVWYVLVWDFHLRTQVLFPENGVMWHQVSWIF
jgi:hypothetical protein